MNKQQKSDSEKNVPGLTDILKESYSQLKNKHLFAAFLMAGCTLLLGLSLLIAAEYLFYLPSVFKISYWVLLILASLISGLWLYRKSNYDSFRDFCMHLSDAQTLPELKNAIDFIYNDRAENSRFLELALEQNIEKVKRADLKTKTVRYIETSLERKRFQSTALFFLLAIFMILGSAFTFPDSLDRSMTVWKTFEKPNPYTYMVKPGSITLEQGDSFSPVIHFEGAKPAEVELAFKTDIEETYRTRIPADTYTDSVVFASLSMNTTGTYYFEMDGYESKTFRAEVQLLPRFESLAVKVIPPDYTRLDTASYHYPFSTIRAYKGSKMLLEGRTNKGLSRLSLITHTEADTLQLSPIQPKAYSHSFDITRQDTLSFFMADNYGLTNKNSFEFVVEPLEDEYPLVQLNQPETNLEMKNPESLELEYEASDDFGLTATRLHYEIQRAFQQDADKQSVSLPIPAMNRSEQFTWKVQELNPKPRDVITFWITVADNDQINGSKTSRTRSLTITFPSLTEFVDELENKERNVQEKLQDISDSHEQVRQEYDRFKQKLQENPQGNWEQKQSIEQLKKQQESIDEQVEELNKEFENIRKELEDSDLLSEESRKAYEELQQLMKEIDDPELAKALEELQKALGNVSQEELRKALENYEFNEQQYRERLKRTVELFKTLKLNSDLEKLAKAFEELAREEKALSEEQHNSSEELSKQEAVQQDLEKLEEELQKLSENPPAKAKQQLKELQDEAGNEIDETKKELLENIEQLKENTSKQDRNRAKEQQKRIQQQFDKLAQQMRSARQQMQQQRQQVNVTALQYILHSLINLSQNQEELSREISQLSNRSQAFVEKARDERQIEEQFTRLADSLFKVSSEIPGFSNSINKKKNVVQQNLRTAVEQMAERDKSRSSFAGRQSMGGINELSTMIASLLDQLQNSQGQGGGAMSMQQFMEQMQQMSGQQQKLNQQIQDYINDIQGNRLSKDQVERLNQMARQQNQIRKQIEELQKNGGLESGDQVLSELERLSEEMEKTINDLRGGETDPFMIKRQQNILSRMLNAEEALQERGEEEKREGTSAEDAPTRVSPDVTIEELQKQIRKLLNDPDQTKFSEDYQRLIEQYFELLKNLESDQDSTIN